MAAGKPMLAAVHQDSQGAEILRDAQAGVLVPPDDPAALIRGVKTLKSLGPEWLAETGRRNRLYAEAHFDQRRIVAEHEAFMMERIAQTRSSRVEPRTA